MKKLIPFLLVFSISCAGKMPPDLTPPAQVAFHAARVVTVLDLVRDSAFILTPAPLSTSDTRIIVIWHQTSVQLILASPGGWLPIVRAGIFSLTCDPSASDIQPAPPCKSPLPQDKLDKLLPYFRVALLVMSQATRDISEEIINKFINQCLASLAVDKAWLESH